MVSMKLRYVVMDYSKGQKPDVLMKLVKHALDRALLLKKSFIAKQPSGMKTGYHSGEFLNQCLMNRLFSISEDERVSMAHSLRRSNHTLKPSEGFVQLTEHLIIENVHKGAWQILSRSYLISELEIRRLKPREGSNETAFHG
jgi:hypothetical protein